MVTDEELHNDHLTSIKFWSRDQITNQLRKASKGSPKTQGNSILALVGLANAISSFEENESKEDRMRTPDQFISVRSWLLKVADTVMVVFDGNYKPASKPFQWCQQVDLSLCFFYVSLICNSALFCVLVQHKMLGGIFRAEQRTNRRFRMAGGEILRPQK